MAEGEETGGGGNTYGIGVSIDASQAQEGARVFKRSADQIKESAEEIKESTEETGESFRGLKHELEEIAEGGVREALESITEALEHLNTGLRILGVGAVIIELAELFEEAKHLEEELTHVQIVANLTAEQFKELESTAKGLSDEFGRSQTDVITAQLQAARAGYKNVAENAEVARNAIELSRIGFVDAATAAGALTRVMETFGASATDATDIMQSLFVVAKQGKFDISQLDQLFGRLGPTIRESGVSINEALASISALGQTGTSARIAMASMQQILRTVAEPTSNVEKAFDRLSSKFKAAGISATSLQDLVGQRGLLGAIKTIYDLTGGNKQALSEIFGGQEAGAAAFNLATVAAERYSESLRDIADKRKANGEADEAYEKNSGEAADTLRIRIVNAFQSLAETIFNAMGPVFRFLNSNFVELEILAGVVATTLTGKLLLAAISTTAEFARVALAAKVDAIALKAAQVAAEEAAAGIYAAGGAAAVAVPEMTALEGVIALLGGEITAAIALTAGIVGLFIAIKDHAREAAPATAALKDELEKMSKVRLYKTEEEEAPFKSTGNTLLDNALKERLKEEKKIQELNDQLDKPQRPREARQFAGLGTAVVAEELDVVKERLEDTEATIDKYKTKLSEAKVTGLTELGVRDPLKPLDTEQPLLTNKLKQGIEFEFENPLEESPKLKPEEVVIKAEADLSPFVKEVDDLELSKTVELDLKSEGEKPSDLFTDKKEVEPPKPDEKVDKFIDDEYKKRIDSINTLANAQAALNKLSANPKFEAPGGALNDTRDQRLLQASLRAEIRAGEDEYTKYGRALDAVKDKNDPLAKATNDYKVGLKELSDAGYKAGVSQTSLAHSQALLSDKLRESTISANLKYLQDAAADEATKKYLSTISTQALRLVGLDRQYQDGRLTIEEYNDAVLDAGNQIAKAGELTRPLTEGQLKVAQATDEATEAFERATRLNLTGDDFRSYIRDTQVKLDEARASADTFGDKINSLVGKYDPLLSIQAEYIKQLQEINILENNATPEEKKKLASASNIAQTQHSVDVDKSLADLGIDVRAKQSVDDYNLSIAKLNALLDAQEISKEQFNLGIQETNANLVAAQAQFDVLSQAVQASGKAMGDAIDQFLTAPAGRFKDRVRGLFLSFAKELQDSAAKLLTANIQKDIFGALASSKNETVAKIGVNLEKGAGISQADANIALGKLGVNLDGAGVGLQTAAARLLEAANALLAPKDKTAPEASGSDLGPVKAEPEGVPAAEQSALTPNFLTPDQGSFAGTGPLLQPTSAIDNSAVVPSPVQLVARVPRASQSISSSSIRNQSGSVSSIGGSVTNGGTSSVVTGGSTSSTTETGASLNTNATSSITNQEDKSLSTNRSTSTNLGGTSNSVVGGISNTATEHSPTSTFTNVAGGSTNIGGATSTVGGVFSSTNNAPTSNTNGVSSLVSDQANNSVVNTIGGTTSATQGGAESSTISNVEHREAPSINSISGGSSIVSGGESLTNVGGNSSTEVGGSTLSTQHGDTFSTQQGNALTNVGAPLTTVLASPTITNSSVEGASSVGDTQNFSNSLRNDTSLRNEIAERQANTVLPSRGLESGSVFNQTVGPTISSEAKTTSSTAIGSGPQSSLTVGDTTTIGGSIAHTDVRATPSNGEGASLVIPSVPVLSSVEGSNLSQIGGQQSTSIRNSNSNAVVGDTQTQVEGARSLSAINQSGTLNSQSSTQSLSQTVGGGTTIGTTTINTVGGESVVNQGDQSLSRTVNNSPESSNTLLSSSVSNTNQEGSLSSSQNTGGVSSTVSSINNPNTSVITGGRSSVVGQSFEGSTSVGGATSNIANSADSSHVSNSSAVNGGAVTSATLSNPTLNNNSNLSNSSNSNLSSPSTTIAGDNSSATNFTSSPQTIGGTLHTTNSGVNLTTESLTNNQLVGGSNSKTDGASISNGGSSLTTQAVNNTHQNSVVGGTQSNSLTNPVNSSSNTQSEGDQLTSVSSAATNNGGVSSTVANNSANSTVANTPTTSTTSTINQFDSGSSVSGTKTTANSTTIGGNSQIDGDNALSNPSFFSAQNFEGDTAGGVQNNPNTTIIGGNTSATNADNSISNTTSGGGIANSINNLLSDNSDVTGAGEQVFGSLAKGVPAEKALAAAGLGFGEKQAGKLFKKEFNSFFNIGGSSNNPITNSSNTLGHNPSSSPLSDDVVDSDLGDYGDALTNNSYFSAASAIGDDAAANAGEGIAASAAGDAAASGAGGISSIIPELRSLVGFAGGGSAKAGQTAMVGETGPELVTFGHDAHVSTNDQVRQAVGAASSNSSPTVVSSPNINVPVQVVNVSHPDDVPNAMQGSAGAKAILNVISKNRTSVNSLLGS